MATVAPTEGVAPLDGSQLELTEIAIRAHRPLWLPRIDEISVAERGTLCHDSFVGGAAHG